MTPAHTTHQRNKSASRAWGFRLAFGGTLISLSVWGITLCNQLFRSSLGPDSLPTDAGFANLGARVAWLLFFGPVAAAGVVMVWSTLRKMGALDQLSSWLSERAGSSNGLPANNQHAAVVVSGNVASDPRGVENLSPESVKRLQRVATRTAVILGVLAGSFLLGVGIFGLVSLLFFSRPSSGASIYPALLTARIAIYFADASGISVILGLAILQRTLREQNTSWLLPLRVFTHLLLKHHRPGPRTKSANRPLLER